MKLTRNVKMLIAFGFLAFVGVIVYKFLTEFVILKILWLVILTFAMTFLSVQFLSFSNKIIKENSKFNFLLFFLFFSVLSFIVIGNCFNLKAWMLPLFAYAWAIPMAILEKKKLLHIREK